MTILAAFAKSNKSKRKGENISCRHLAVQTSETNSQTNFYDRRVYRLSTYKPYEIRCQQIFYAVWEIVFLMDGGDFSIMAFINNGG